MPNHVLNIVTLYGDEKQIAALKQIYCMEKGADLLDFNKIIPMPEALNIEAGSKTDQGIWLYLMAADPYDEWPQAKVWGYEKLQPETYMKLKTMFPDGMENHYWRESAKEIRSNCTENQKGRVKMLLELGKQAAENMLQYGAKDWYDWCIKHWGSKWNAYGSSNMKNSEPNQLVFLSAWDSPEPVIQKLSQLYPDFLLKHQWADENLGYNLGERYYRAGKLEMEHVFEYGSQEAVQFAETLFEWEEVEQSETLTLELE